MTAWRRVAVCVALLLALVAREARAQAPASASAVPALRPWRPVLALGGGWLGAQSLGRVEAVTRGAVVGSTAPAFRLFTTESTLQASPFGEVTLSLPLTRALAVSVRGAAGRPTLSTAISGDAEGAPAATVTETIADYTVDLSLAYQLPRWGGRRARPYVTAGGGYLRQLHDDNALVETGRTWHGGAGLRWWLRGGGAGTRPVGLTGELRWVWRRDAIAFASGARSAPAAAVSLFAGF